MRINEPLFEVLSDSLSVGGRTFARGEIVAESDLGSEAQWLSDRRLIARIGFRYEEIADAPVAGDAPPPSQG